MRHCHYIKWAVLRAALFLLLLGTQILLGSFFVQSFLRAESFKLRLEKLEVITAQGVHVLNVELARTPQQQATGLMFRRQLPADQGMLFIHETPKEVTMWMRNTYVSLDMIFINEEGRVHRIEEKTEPLSEEIISSQGVVRAVLEVEGGSAQRLGIKPGDQIKSSLLRSP